MLPYAHQLVANRVCLLLGSEQVANGGFITDLFSLWKQLPAAAAWNEPDEGGESGP